MLHLTVTDLHCNGGSNILIEIICLKSIFLSCQLYFKYYVVKLFLKSNLKITAKILKTQKLIQYLICIDRTIE